MKIELTEVAEHSVRLEVSSGVDANDLKVWKKIIADVLLLAYLDKPACLITIDPDKNSVGNELSNLEKIKYSKRTYLINFLEKCTAIELLLLSETYDLELGLLVISSLTRDELETVNLEEMFPILEEEVLLIKYPAVFCAADGEWLYWLNFEISFEQLSLELQKIIHKYGVSFIKKPPIGRQL